MSYRIEFRPSAAKGLASLPPTIRSRITPRVDALAQDPRPPGTRLLTGHLKGARRLRVGDYRVAYQVDDEARRIDVWEIGHRHRFYERAARRR